MSAPGEIARLTEIAAPQVGLITCVAAAHLQGLGSLAGVARAKAELVAGLPRGAAAVLNGDDAPLLAAAAPYLAGRPLMTFGRAAGAAVRLVHVAHAPGIDGAVGLALRLEVAGQQLSGHLSLVGLHNGMNAAGAVAAAMALGISAEAALANMAHVRLPGSRGRVLRVADPPLWILDDCYNANPHSMAAALATLADLAGNARRLAVLGDMLELGDEAPARHRELGQAAVQAGVRWPQSRRQPPWPPAAGPSLRPTPPVRWPRCGRRSCRGTGAWSRALGACASRV